MEDKELDLSNINQIDMEVNFIDDDDDSFGNIALNKSTENNNELEIIDDRPIKRVTGVSIDLSDDVPTLTSKPIKCTSEQDILDAVNDRNTPFGLSQNSSGIFGEDPDYMECSVGEDDDDFVPTKSFDYEDEEEPELVNEDIMNEKRPARVSQLKIEDDYWEKIAKKHKATNVKGAHNLHTHYGGDPKLAMDMFNHDMEPQSKIPTITDTKPATVIATDSAYTSDIASGVGEASGGDGGACCGESKKQNKGSKQLFENLLLITGFELIPDGEQFILKDKEVVKGLRSTSKDSDTKISDKSLGKELIRYAIPFMVVSILGYSYFIIDMLVFNRVMGWRGELSADLIYGIINMNVDKLTSIPMAVAPGFSVAIVPYVTDCFVKGDKEGASRNVVDCITMALYLALPLTLVLLSLATPIYYVMYGGDFAKLGGEILAWYSLDGLASTIAPVVTSLTMALNLRKQNMRNVGVGVIVKLVTVVPFIYVFGYVGALLSSVLGTMAGVVLNFNAITKFINVSYKRIMMIVSKIFLCLLMTQVMFGLLQFVGFKVIDQNRFIALIELGIVGIGGAVAYFVSSFYLGIPQAILHKTNKELFSILRRKSAWCV